MELLSIEKIQEMQLVLMKKIHAFLESNKINYYLIAGSALGAVRHNGFIPWDDDIDIGMFRDDYDNFLRICDKFDGDYSVENFKNSKNCDYCLTRIYFPNTEIDNPQIKDTVLNKKLYFDIFPLDNVPKDYAERSKFEKKIKKKKLLIARIDVRNNQNSRIEMLEKRLFSFFLKPFRNLILRKTDKLMCTYRNATTSLVCSLSSQYSFSKQVMPKEYYGKPTLHVFEDTQFYIPERVNEYLTTLYGNDYMEIPPENKRRKSYNIYITYKE